MERMPAVRLEEAVVSRLMELARNPKVLAQLATDAEVNTEELTKEVDQMINSKEQEKRKLDRMVDNLVATLAELPTGMTPKTILEKIQELEGQREQLARALAELREDRKRKGGGKVINTEHVFRVFRLFQRDFPTRPAHEQREILRSVVSKVVVQENGLRVFYYGSPRDDKLLETSPAAVEAKLLGKPSSVPASKAAKKAANVTNSGPSFDGTGVRAVSGLVEEKRPARANCSPAPSVPAQKSSYHLSCLTLPFFLQGRHIFGVPVFLQSFSSAKNIFLQK